VLQLYLLQAGKVGNIGRGLSVCVTHFVARCKEVASINLKRVRKMHVSYGHLEFKALTHMLTTLLPPPVLLRRLANAQVCTRTNLRHHSTVKLGPACFFVYIMVTNNN